MKATMNALQAIQKDFKKLDRKIDRFIKFRLGTCISI